MKKLTKSAGQLLENLFVPVLVVGLWFEYPFSTELLMEQPRIAEHIALTTSTTEDTKTWLNLFLNSKNI